MLTYIHTALLGIVCVVAFLYVNCMDRSTRHMLRAGFILTSGGAFGHVCTYYMEPLPGDYEWMWVPEFLFHSGLALIAVELARGHANDLLMALRRRLGMPPWNGIERRHPGD